MDITIRKMLPGDLDQVMDILAGWNMAPVLPSDEIPEPERSSIDIGNTIVAVDGERIVGVCSYILLSPEMAETASLAIDADYKGKGIGSMLQKTRLAALREKGIRKVRTEADRPETIDWYVKKFGYTVIGRNKKKHRFSLPEVDYWTVLELDL